jgi:RNA-directed DNA polymerase
MSGTRQKTLDEQLSQTLVAEGRGEALDAETEDAEPLMAKPAPESPALAEQLMEEVCDRGNLERAWKRVRSNKGSPGVDGMTIDRSRSNGSKSRSRTAGSESSACLASSTD